MDMTAIGEKVMEFIKKYRYVLLVLVLGIGLMAIPDGASEAPTAAEETEAAATHSDQTDALIDILSQIDGAGQVRVLLTTASSEKVLYQTDQDTATSADSSSVRYETVIITDTDRAERGLIVQTIGPEYLGAIIVCEGAEDPKVRLCIVEAVANATGLGADRISVLKMK